MSNLVKKKKSLFFLSLTFIFLFIISSSLVSAESFGYNDLEELPTAKLNEDYIIRQTCATCSYVNFTLTNLNGIILNNIEMSDNDSGVWVYNFTPTILGRHDVIGEGDLEGTATSFASSFEVSPTGFIGTNNFFWLILVVCIILVGFGLLKEDVWVTMFGGIATMFLGFYIIINGIDFLKDTTTTYAFGLIVLFVGVYILIRASMEALHEK